MFNRHEKEKKKKARMMVEWMKKEKNGGEFQLKTGIYRSICRKLKNHICEIRVVEIYCTAN